MWLRSFIGALVNVVCRVHIFVDILPIAIAKSIQIAKHQTGRAVRVENKFIPFIFFGRGGMNEKTAVIDHVFF